MRTISSIVMAAACLWLAPERATAQDKPRLLEIGGFMVKGALTELDPQECKRRLSLAELERLHLDGTSTAIDEILNLMARTEKIRARIEEPLAGAR